MNRNQGKAYIVNIFDSASQQKQMIEKFCKNTTLEITNTYITTAEQNSEKLYELIRDIKNKVMDVLIVTVFSIYSILDKEWAVIVKLCRDNNINIVEI